MSCPGEFAEFPAAAWEAGSGAETVWVSALALPLPFPLPARAEPVNAAMPRASRIMLVRPAIRLVISFFSSFSNNIVSGVTFEETSEQPIWIRVTRTISLDLSAKLSAERLFQCRNDAVSEPGGVLVRECPVG